MSWLFGRQQHVTSFVRGMATNCNNPDRLKYVLGLQIRNDNCMMKLQTLKPYAHRHAGELAVMIPTCVPEPTRQYALMLGPVLKVKEYLYESSNFKTLLSTRQPWNSFKVAAFSTQSFEKSVSQFKSDPMKGSQKLSAGQAGGKKSQAMLLYLLALVVAMVGSTYAAVPLYRKFCQATGYGGTVQRREV